MGNVGKEGTPQQKQDSEEIRSGKTGFFPTVGNNLPWVGGWVGDCLNKNGHLGSVSDTFELNTKEERNNREA